MAIVLDIVVWILLWIIPFGLLSFITKKGITYNKNYGWLVIFFLFFTLLAGVYFRDLLKMVDGTFTSIPFVVLVLVYLVTSLAYAFSHKYIQSPSRLIERYPQQFFIQMDYRYLVSKSFDILFQQMMILMPVIFTIMFLGFPSGLVIYWLTNNILTVLIQWLVLKKSK